MKRLGFALWIVVVLVAMVAILEVGLRFAMGFGNPVLYDNTYAYGYRPLPNQEVRRTAGKRIRINNLGLRARRDWPAGHDTTSLRLLVLGSSVAYGGSYIDDSETFAERSGERLASILGRTVQTGNAAVNGWGPLNIKGLVQRLGFFGADVAVVVAGESDLERGMSTIGEVPYWNHKPSSAMEEVASSWWAYKLSVRRYLRKEAFLSPAEIDSYHVATIHVYLDIARRARESHARVLMVWHPSRSAVAGKENEAHRELFLESCRREGHATLDMTPILRQQAEGHDALFVDPNHLSARGHEAYGRALGDTLARLVHG
jgi:hypothetical protein